MTSNVGTRDIKTGGGYGFSGTTVEDQYSHLKNTVEDAMKKLFNPEFVNRLDETIVFRSLDLNDIKQIIPIEMKDLIKNISDNKMSIEINKSAAEFLAEKGYDPKFGARPLKRAIQKYVEDPLAEELLLAHFKEGDKIVVKHKKNSDELYFIAGKAAETEENDNAEKEKVE